MSGKERYIRQVLDRVFASAEDRQRLRDDIEAHFAEGLAAGESETDIVRRLGPAEEVAASFMENVTFRYAGFWIRVLAFGVDVALCILALLPPALLLSLTQRATGGEGETPPLFFAVAVPFVLWGAAIFIFYFPLAEYRFGKTLGKHLLGLQVLDESGTRPSLGRTFLRRLSFYFRFLVLDSLFVPFTAKKQRALDIVAKTIVIRETGEPRPGRMLAAVAILLGAVPLLWLFARAMSAVS